MASTLKVLVESKYAEAVQTTQYTSPANTLTTLDTITATNVGASAATISVNLGKSGDSAANFNLITSTREIAANESYSFPELTGHSLSAGGFLSTLASASNTIVIRISGRQIT